ncbi:hypothetical protein [Lysobacter solisilvae (ex Woo and Kim 2020)]|uniref:EF-hand domain-containing protein n=1 Tax=Agrilutibacter terrestris TaxID=2865112 RepID=A0A7H0FVC0_9GAMM|nr:hypothetical protein [Lysobacter terrestris]QNP39986.1 hypothetical protein H8B22_10795 [Lysobacter terrestris]
MKNWMITLLGSLVVAGAAQAAQPQATQAQTAPAVGAASVPQDEAKQQDQVDRNCLRYTGTRITHRASADKNGSAKSRMCSNGQIGRVYTREDLDRTGRINTADALRTLDASIY